MEISCISPWCGYNCDGWSALLVFTHLKLLRRLWPQSCAKSIWCWRMKHFANIDLFFFVCFLWMYVILVIISNWKKKSHINLFTHKSMTAINMEKNLVFFALPFYRHKFLCWAEYLSTHLLMLLCTVTVYFVVYFWYTVAFSWRAVVWIIYATNRVCQEMQVFIWGHAGAIPLPQVLLQTPFGCTAKCWDHT